MFIEAIYKVKKVIYLDDNCNVPKVIEELVKSKGQIANTNNEIIMIEEVDEYGPGEFIYSDEFHGQPTCSLYCGDVEVWNNSERFKQKKEGEENE